MAHILLFNSSQWYYHHPYFINKWIAKFNVSNYKDFFLKLQMCIDGARLWTQIVQMQSLKLHYLSPDLVRAHYSKAITDQEHVEIKKKEKEGGPQHCLIPETLAFGEKLLLFRWQWNSILFIIWKSLKNGLVVCWNQCSVHNQLDF